MCGGLEREQISLLSLALADTYKDFGMTESPESLYTDDVILNDEGEFIHHGQKKVMPTLSDFHERLVLASKQDGNECLIPVANSLQMFIKTGVYGLFDTQTSPELVNMKAAPVITLTYLVWKIRCCALLGCILLLHGVGRNLPKRI